MTAHQEDILLTMSILHISAPDLLMGRRQNDFNCLPDNIFFFRMITNNPSRPLKWYSHVRSNHNDPCNFSFIYKKNYSITRRFCGKISSLFQFSPTPDELFKVPFSFGVLPSCQRSDHRRLVLVALLLKTDYP